MVLSHLKKMPLCRILKKIYQTKQSTQRKGNKNHLDYKRIRKFHVDEILKKSFLKIKESIFLKQYT